MTLRITRSSDRKGLWVRVEGRLTSEGVSDLDGELRRAGPSARLDLSGLTALDDVAAHELLALLQGGLRMSGMSAYIRQVLKEAAKS